MKLLILQLWYRNRKLRRQLSAHVCQLEAQLERGAR
jgi:hypothetical protein